MNEIMIMVSEDPQVKHRVINRHPVHPSITPAQISDLVDIFYVRVRSDEELGPMFDKRLEDRWEDHLLKMKTFWEAVLLRTGAYKGKPVPTHMKLKEVVSTDFKSWLELFRKTAAECFAPDAVPLVIETAERIAQSLWLAMFGSPISRPPDWMVTPDQPTENAER